MQSINRSVIVAVLFLFFSCLSSGISSGHAFPDHSDPKVGSTVASSPSIVRIWFDGDIEPVFSTIRVENDDKQRVDQGDGRVDPKDSTLLETTLQPSLPPGKYHVYWSVIARDGHRTDGDYAFRVK